MTFDRLPRCPVCEQTIRIDQAVYTWFKKQREYEDPRRAAYRHGICGALDAADRGFAESLLAAKSAGGGGECSAPTPAPAPVRRNRYEGRCSGCGGPVLAETGVLSADVPCPLAVPCTTRVVGARASTRGTSPRSVTWTTRRRT